MGEFSWKKFQFITEVQTVLINNAVNRSRDGDGSDKHTWAGSGTLITMDDAFYAAERIPANMTAHEAACDFLEIAIWRKDGGTVPTWFMRT